MFVSSIVKRMASQDEEKLDEDFKVESPLVSFLKNGNLRSLLSNDVVIIIGAVTIEPHVIQYKAEHPHVYVITISYPGGHRYGGHFYSSPSHLRNNFNELKFWEKLQDALKERNVVQIIVDWSTVQAMRQGKLWDVPNGGIFKVVRQMLTRAKGSFIFPIGDRNGYTAETLKDSGGTKKIKNLFNLDGSINYPLKNESFYEVYNEEQTMAEYKKLIENPTKEIQTRTNNFDKRPPGKWTTPTWISLSTQAKIEKLGVIIDEMKSKKVKTDPKYCEISFP